MNIFFILIIILSIHLYTAGQKELLKINVYSIVDRIVFYSLVSFFLAKSYASLCILISNTRIQIFHSIIWITFLFHFSTLYYNFSVFIKFSMPSKPRISIENLTNLILLSENGHTQTEVAKMVGCSQKA